MKSKRLPYKTGLLLSLLISMMLIGHGCSKDDNGQVDPPANSGEIESKPGITEADIDAYQGELGIFFDVRPIVKKGYKPKNIEVTTGATQGNYDATLEIDDFTHIGKLSVEVENLTKEAADELKDGVQITAIVKDENGAVLITEEFEKQLFSSNGPEIQLDDDSLPKIHSEVNFMPGASYYLQYTVNGSLKGNPNYYGTWVNSPDGTNSIVVRRQLSFLPERKHEQFGFYKYPNEENLFAIYVKSTNRYLAVHPDGWMRSSGLVTFGVNDPATIGDQYKFRIWKTDQGFYRIGDINGNPFYEIIGQNAWGTGNGTVTSAMGEIGDFKIVTADIDWKAEDLGTKFLTPILPPAESVVGFSSTLINCSSGNLENQVGYTEELRLTRGSRFSETVWMSGRITAGVGLTVSAETVVPIFGYPVKVRGEVSTSLEVSVEMGTEQSFEKFSEVTSTETISTNRTITVPAGKGTLITDSYQKYNQITLPYVQRIRITGKLNGVDLTSAEIKEMLYASTFDGVVQDAGATFVEVSLRGNMNLGNMYETESVAEDVADACRN